MKHFTRKCLSLLLAVTMTVALLPALHSSAQKQSADGKIILDSVEQGINADLILLHSTNESYAVLTARLKALVPVTHDHDWYNTVGVGVSGTKAWTNYAFQLCYGSNGYTNLVKLCQGDTEYRDACGQVTWIPQDQWQNNPKLEELFDDQGLNIKIVRMKDMAYLLMDMGNGYEPVGQMTLPESAPTEFTLYNGNTSLRMSKMTVETGMDAAFEAFSGMTINHRTDNDNSNRRVSSFPIDSKTWMLEGKLFVDADNAWDKEDNWVAYAGTTSSWSNSLAVNKYNGQTWIGKCIDLGGDWSETSIDDKYTGNLGKTEGFMWVRWMRDGQKLSLWTSEDGVNWTLIKTSVLPEQAGTGCNISFDKNAKLTDMKIAPDVYYPTEYEITEGKGVIVEGNYTRADKYAVMSGVLNVTGAWPEGPNGEDNWNNNLTFNANGDLWKKAFQLLMPKNDRNLVKVDSPVNDGFQAPVETWLNRPELKQKLCNDGLPIKLVRINTWTYLLADMGDGYEMIGRTGIGSDDATQFFLNIRGTQAKLSGVSITTGKEETLAELDDVSIGEDVCIPLDSKTWTLEGRLSVDLTNLTYNQWNECYGAYVAPTSWEHMIAVMCKSGDNDGKWRATQLTDWVNHYYFTDAQQTKLNQAEGGLWVRWTRNDAEFKLEISEDKVNWITAKTDTAVGDVDAKGIFYFNPEPTSRLTNTHIRLDEASRADMYSDDIQVKTMPATTKYMVGDRFDPAGMSLKLMKNGAEVKDVPLDQCTITPNGPLTSDNTEITVSYRGFTAKIPVQVSEPSTVMTHAEIKDLPYKIIYKKGENFEAAGATYLATFDDGKLQEYDITPEMCSMPDMSESGEKTVTVTTLGLDKKLTFTVTVDSDAVPIDPNYEQASAIDSSYNGGNKSTTAPETGDTTTPIVISAVEMLLAVAGMVALVVLKRRQEREYE